MAIRSRTWVWPTSGCAWTNASSSSWPSGFRLICPNCRSPEGFPAVCRRRPARASHRLLLSDGLRAFASGGSRSHGASGAALPGVHGVSYVLPGAPGAL